MDGKNSRIRAFDLFCGAGGSSCGASQAGVEIAGGIDLWDKAVKTFEANYPGAVVFKRRADQLTAKEVARKVGPIDLLLASPECTNHSVAKGAVPRDETSRRTAFEVIRFAKAWKPRWVAVENVVTMQRWHAYGEWLRKLQCLGYRTRELRVNAEHFGVPQSRRRLIVIADLERDPTSPQRMTQHGPNVKSILGRGNDGDGYNYESRPLFVPSRAGATVVRAERAIEAVGPKKPFLLVYYGSDAAGGWQSLDRPLRTITTLDRFALVVPKATGHEIRMLQPLELAAAMGFPDNYVWPKTTRREHIKLIGNAVAPPVMRAIVEALIS